MSTKTSTIAELDPNAFSAVAAFFGQDENDETKNNNDDGMIIPNKRNSNRMGVGAVSSSIPQNTTNIVGSSSSREAILNVGKHSKNKYTEEEEEEEPQQEDDDEEDGRTSAIQEKVPNKKIPTLPMIPSETKKKKKKKIGKKERLAQKIKQDNESQTNEISTTKDNPEEEEGKDSNMVEDDSEKATTDNVKKNDEDVDGIATTNKKKKRKRVRSKQKNIRKDNRTFQEKPNHLKVFVGNKNYKGRPLTEETRNYFQLGESVTSQRRNQKGTLPTKHDDTDGGGLAIETLAVDEFSTTKNDDTNNIDDGELVNPQKESENPSAKKKEKEIQKTQI